MVVLSKINEIHLEVTDQCNLNCNYCYFIEKNKIKEENKSEYLIDFIKKLICQTNEKFIKVIFHGGEPLFRNAVWYDSICTSLTNTTIQFEKKIAFQIQTNGILLNKNHIDIFKKHNIQVNVSLDGTEEIHNAFRGNYKRTLNSIKELQANHLFMSVIVVISKHNYNKIKNIVNHLVGLNIISYHFNLASIIGLDKSLILSTDEIIEFNVDSFELFKVNYKNICDWRLLDKLRRFTKKTIPKMTCDSPICHAGTHMIHLRQNGDFYPCGSCVSNSDSFDRFKIGNINDSLTTNVYEQKLMNFHKLYFDRRESCELCEAAYICEFSCPAFDIYDSLTAQNRCNANKMFYEFLKKQNKNEIENIVQYYDK